MNTRFAVVIGLDVAKSSHHACALYLDGEKLFDKPLPQDEATLRDLFTELQDRGSGGRGHVGGFPLASVLMSMPGSHRSHEDPAPTTSPQDE